MGYMSFLVFVLLHLRENVCLDYNVLRHAQEKMLRTYSKTLRPVNDTQTSVAVRVNVSMINVFDLDISTELLTTSLRLDLVWRDERFSGSDVITRDGYLSLSSKDVWIPQLSVLNSPMQQNGFMNEDTVKVSHGGEMMLRTEIDTKTHCDIDILTFPFDKQECAFKIILKHSIDEVQLASFGFAMDDLASNHQWKIVDISSKRVIVNEKGQLRSGFRIKVNLDRHLGYYLSAFIWPVFIIFFMNITILKIRPKSGERISAAITLFVSFTVFLSLLQSILPGAFEKSPLVSVFLYVMFTLSGLVVAYCVMIENWTSRKIVTVLGKLVCICRQTKVRDECFENDQSTDACYEDIAEQIIAKLDGFFCSICCMLTLGFICFIVYRASM